MRDSTRTDDIFTPGDFAQLAADRIDPIEAFYSPACDGVARPLFTYAGPGLDHDLSPMGERGPFRPAAAPLREPSTFERHPLGWSFFLLFIALIAFCAAAQFAHLDLPGL